MESSEGATQAAPAPTVDTSRLDLLAEVMEDDTRSSSLSDVGDRLEAEHLDFSPHKVASEVDSEAETERIEDSPHRVRNKTSIVLSAAGYETSPSKLAQSTTYDDLPDDDDDDEIEVSPSKAKRSVKTNGVEVDNDSNEEDETLSSPQEVTGRKRKRVASIGDISEVQNADEPSRKRRGSMPVARTSPLPSVELRPRGSVTEPTSKSGGVENDETPAPEEDNVIETRALKGRKGKKGQGKRKGKRTRDADDQVEEESNLAENGVGNEAGEDEENVEPAEEADDAEAALKLEEAMRKTNAMDTLASLEHQFATLRDRVYEDRIAKYNEQLAQLEGPNPTHPEYLRQAEAVKQHCDRKIEYENNLFKFKLETLITKSKAERAQINSTYEQRIRDLQESYLEKLARLNCQIQQDRFQTSEASPEYSIPFPTSRAAQVAQQAAYNTEVSVLAGFAKYVGFPASPAVPGLTPQERDEDLAKMGIRLPTRVGHNSSAGHPHG